MHGVWISKRWEWLRCFDTDVIGVETEIFQGSQLRNLQYQRGIKEHKADTKAVQETAAEPEAPKLLATLVNNILHWISSKVVVCFNNQQFYNSNGLYAHKSYIYNNFKGVTFENKGVFHCRGYYNEKVPENFFEVPLTQPFLSIRMQRLSRPDGFMWHGKLGVDFFSTS